MEKQAIRLIKMPSRFPLHGIMKFALCCVWVLLAHTIEAQTPETAATELEVKGQVTNHSGEGIPGVNVLVKESNSGTVTDIEGNYTIDAPEEGVLVFSSIGFQTQEVPVGGRTTISIALIEDTQTLNEVVVTALGIEKDKKRVGYAIQELEGESLQKAVTPNVTESLTGKIAGLTITNSNDFFSDPGIYLRGKKPLIVVDGVPNPNTDMWNINSNDIETISVLKSAAASALYGSLGTNGAIQITLKDGSKAPKGTSVSVNSSTTFQTGFIRIPRIQTQYGPGNAGVYEFGTGAAGGGGKNDFDYSIWGPKFDGRLLPQFDSPIDPETGERIPTPWVARGPDNLGNFMETGMLSSNNVTIQSNGDIGSLTLSNTYEYAKASVPGAKLNINTTRLRGSLNVSDDITLDASLQYNYQFASNLPRADYGPHSPIYLMAIWGGAHYDIRNFKDYWEPGKEGIRQHWVEYWRYNNPYMLAHEWKRPYRKNDILGYLKLDFEIAENLNAFVRTSLNTYNLTQDEEIAVDIYDYSISDRGGRYRHNEYYLFESNTDFLINYSKNIFDNVLGIQATLGGNQRFYSYSSVSASTDQLVVPGVFKLSNSVDKVTPTSYKEQKGVYSAYSSLDLAYKNVLYLSLTGRIDKSSTLPVRNSSFFYPSISLSAIVSDMVSLPQAISLLKLRGAYAKVGGDLDIYTAINSYSTGGRKRNLPVASYPDILDNADLQPSFNTTYEYGVEMNFLNNRLGVDFSYYRNTYGPQIFTQNFSQTSGYSGILSNGRETQRRGFDFSVFATPLQKGPFTWTTLFNFDRGKDYLISMPPLPDGTPQLADGRIKIGDQLDDYYYYEWETSPDGQLVIQSNGLPQRIDQRTNQGNTQPNFTASINNTFTYKSFSLNVLFDGRFGGITYDRYNRDLWRSGSHPDAIHPERELSNIAYNNGTDASTMLIPGVKVVEGEAIYDPEGNLIEDTRKFEPNDYKVDYQSWASSYQAAWEKNIIEKTFIKLREIALTYNLPSSLLNIRYLKAASISLVGRNLLYWTKDDTFGDLDIYTMSTGDTDLQLPSQRTFGFNLNLNF